MPLVAGLMSVGLGLSAGCGAAAGGPSGASGRAASSAAPGPGGSSGRPDMTAPAGSAAGRTTNVPMKVVREGRAVLEIVPVSINGSGPYDFLLDTGSAVSSVDKALAARLRLRTTGKTEHVRGVTGSAEVSLTRIGRWKLGPLALAPENVGVVDLSKRSQGGIAGLLGSDQLHKFGAITIDFGHRRLVVAHPR